MKLLTKSKRWEVRRFAAMHQKATKPDPDERVRSEVKKILKNKFDIKT